MMQFLKSILSIGKLKREKTKTQDLRIELSTAIERIETLEEQLILANNTISDLNNYVKDIAHATQSLSHEVMCITTLLQQAADMTQKENEMMSWHISNTDDDGILN